jgi:glycosyltransferase involved in cell wall biosynthesis
MKVHQKNKSILSVVMSAAKYDPYFEEAIRSIINQTYRPIEIVLIVEDDLDIYESKLAAVCNKVNGISYIIQHSQIHGFCYCLNRAVEISSGEYLARMDTDDISNPDRFQLQIAYLEENLSCTVLGTKAVPIDAESKRIGKDSLPFFGSDEIIRAVLPYRNPIFHSSVMMRKREFLRLGAYKYDFYAQDHELWIRYSLIRGVQFHNLDVELYNYRRYEGQATSLVNASKGAIEISAFLFKYFLLTKNIKFLFGIFVVNPYIRRINSFMRGFK